MIQCEFCRVRSYLLPQQYFRYRLPHRSDPADRLIYIPYWRFKGMVFACAGNGLSHRFMDISHVAINGASAPVTLGLRTQALKLRFVTPDDPGRFLNPDVPFAAARSEFDAQAVARVRPPVHHCAQIGEAVSLIYAPVYQSDRLYDAVLDAPMGAVDHSLDTDRAGGPPDGRIRFITTLCPSCGWDLDGASESMALFCRNCDRAWVPKADALTQVPFTCLPRTHEGPTIYIPFWRIAAPVSGLALSSYADLVRLANLPRVVQSDWEAQPFRFWVPAFKVRPHTMMMLARQLTLTQPASTGNNQIPKEEIAAATLPITEALEMLKPVLAEFMKPAQIRWPQLPDIRITPASLLLALVPFRITTHEYIYDELSLAININQLSLAGNL